MRALALTLSLAMLGSALVALPALAQNTPADVRDLVGARAPGGEAELGRRGYVNVRGQKGDDRSWTYWWNSRRGVCLSVATRQGRFDSIVGAPAPDCRQRPPVTPPPTNLPSRPPGGGGGGGNWGPGAYTGIVLVCYGEGQRIRPQVSSGYEWDDSRGRYVPRNRTEWGTETYDSTVTIQIEDGRGRIRPARSMIPPINSGGSSGWFNIASLRVTPGQITGQFKLNGANRPKITIDRRSGRIVLDGLTKFRGSCDRVDGRDHRRF